MKVSKIPGLGRFGIYIDDVDFDNLTQEEWVEIGKLHLKNLVTIIRNTNLKPKAYAQWMERLATCRYLPDYRFSKKYGKQAIEFIMRSRHGGDLSELSPEDLDYILKMARLMPWQEDGTPLPLLAVSGKKDADGNPIGTFADGELLWHSSESGNLAAATDVSLLAYEGTVGSSTGFLTTVDWYEQQSNAFRSELDEMVMLHSFTPGRINPGLTYQYQDDIMEPHMCPVPNTEIPLVINSPGGYTGLHYPVNTIDSIKGMTKEESQKVFDQINKTLFTEEHIFDHWYKNDGDLLIFDNSITLHRRLGEIKNRLGFRYQFDFDKQCLDKPYMPYRQEPYISMYREQITDIVKVSNLKYYWLP